MIVHVQRARDPTTTTDDATHDATHDHGDAHDAFDSEL
jgi:hypothetical protein